MKYTIDYTALADLAMQEITGRARQRTTEDGKSLYDAIMPYSNDTERIIAMIREACSLLQARTYSICRWDYANEDKYYVIGTGGTRFLVRDETPTSDSKVYHPDFTEWAGTLQVTIVSGKYHLAFTPTGLYTQTTGDLDTTKYVYNMYGEALNFYVPDLPSGYEERCTKAIDRYIQLAVTSQWMQYKGITDEVLAGGAAQALLNAIVGLKTRTR